MNGPQAKTIAEQRAAEALGRVTGSGDQIVMHIGSYSTDLKGRSVRATLGHRFADAHKMVGDEEVDELYDPKTGALVILPKGAIEDGLEGE